MKQKLKIIYHKTLFGKVIQYLFHSSKNKIWADSWVIKYNYWKSTGLKLNLKNPKTLNEKINWLKINDRTALHTICADKFKVRDYISNEIGSEYLIPLLFETKNAAEINESTIPDTPNIIKTNHDSGGVIIVFDKRKVNYAEIQKRLQSRLNKNYYYNQKEWQYKNIKPRIIIEKLLLTRENEIPMDYKIHCLNGNPHMIQVDIGRNSQNHYRNWYYPNWKRCPFKWTALKDNGKTTEPADFDIKPPARLDKMLELSKKLASPFDYARIDWYDVNDKIYFGEITFHHDSGTRLIEPIEWDYKLGEILKLRTI
ncbi:ATP-grasp fold amidoligase family protein [uncultured Maribacter sp.]|uniref:ATP-grasp fold amidoligase family protein n=1 Tax=uncultured Maribacter sp. TaxID=431308 RepID=UPI0030D8F7F8|tara:strand:- start:476 stop:1411 length:936 start_codon:yes stop_codon:yes gene_type:complete